jgi:hypothetical protein
LGSRRHPGRVAAGTLLGQLEDDLDVRRLLNVAIVQGEIGVGAGQRLLDLFQELVGGRAVADDPIDLVAVLVDEELGRRPADVELLEDAVPDLVVAAGPIDDDVVVEEIGVLGIVVKLLNQQSAAPSATRVEIDEDELVLFLRLDQRLLERSFEDRRRLGGGEGGDEEEAGECGELLHSVLRDRAILPGQHNGFSERMQSRLFIHEYAAVTAEVAPAG